MTYGVSACHRVSNQLRIHSHHILCPQKEKGTRKQVSECHGNQGERSEPWAESNAQMSEIVTPASVVKGYIQRIVRLLTLIDPPKHNNEEIYLPVRNFILLAKYIMR